MPNLSAGRGSPILWLLFSLRGRISRRLYWLTYLLLVALQSAILAQIWGGEYATLHRYAVNFGPAVILATLYVTLTLSVKRLHDVGYSGFLAVALLIPFVNILFTVWVGILPGTAGPNPYGEAADAPPR